jgi:hypothetical protein
VRTTKTRLPAGSKGTAPLPVTKIPKVGVAPALIVVVTVGGGGLRQAPSAGLVWQIPSEIGSDASPRSADAVMLAATPRFAVATEHTGSRLSGHLDEAVVRERRRQRHDVRGSPRDLVRLAGIEPATFGFEVR